MKESAVEVQKLNSEFLPFGISMSQVEQNCSGLTGENNNTLFNTQTQKYLRTLMFVSPKTSSQFFYHWQRQRKMWWKKVFISEDSILNTVKYILLLLFYLSALRLV